MALHSPRTSLSTRRQRPAAAGHIGGTGQGPRTGAVVGRRHARVCGQGHEPGSSAASPRAAAVVQTSRASWNSGFASPRELDHAWATGWGGSDADFDAGLPKDAAVKSALGEMR